MDVWISDDSFKANEGLHWLRVTKEGGNATISVGGSNDVVFNLEECSSPTRPTQKIRFFSLIFCCLIKSPKISILTKL